MSDLVSFSSVPHDVINMELESLLFENYHNSILSTCNLDWKQVFLTIW